MVEKEPVKINNNISDNNEIINNKTINYSTYQEWQELLSDYNYSLKDNIINIPNIRITKFPNDFAQIKDIEQRKELFIKIVLIGAYHANRRIINVRLKLEEISNSFITSGTLLEDDKIWLQSRAKEYKVCGSDEEIIDELLCRVDIIPVSLVLAQSACESGWGRSRFVKVANNFFGEWTFNQQEAGVVPKERPVDATYRIRKFATVEDSFISYFNNLNTNPAYQKLREIRCQLREDGLQLDSLKLAEGLINYSEQREEYIKIIKDIIEYNNLKELDSVLSSLGKEN